MGLRVFSEDKLKSIFIHEISLVFLFNLIFNLTQKWMEKKPREEKKNQISFYFILIYLLFKWKFWENVC